MTREEILAKSRQENYDEGTEDARQKGYRLGYITFLLVCIIVIVVNFLTGAESNDVMAMFSAFAAAEEWPVYRFTRKKIHLYTAILSAVAAVIYFIAFMIDALR